ncbi:hypothetical protein, partial [Paraburkholderia phenazinium]|uniref:hypothetical protein n=1 Tax=Paraburkholderia phenazinium TaxID=60549 RepID=UPI001ABB7298
ARSSPTVAMFMMNAPLPWTSQHVHFGTNASPLSGSRPSHQSSLHEQVSHRRSVEPVTEDNGYHTYAKECHYAARRRLADRFGDNDVGGLFPSTSNSHDVSHSLINRFERPASGALSVPSGSLWATHLWMLARPSMQTA